MKKDPVFLFIEKYPSTGVEILIRVSDEINRITKAEIGFEGIIKKALNDPKAGQYLANLCLRFQNNH